MRIDLPHLRKRFQFGSGLVMGAFILGHFSNHALGIVSLGAMERLRELLAYVWRSPPGTVLLYSAIIIHFLLALDALYRRHTLKMPIGEALKIILGLSLPFLIALHVVNTRIDFSLTGYSGGYTDILARMGKSPATMIRQSIALLVAWLHFCLGMWFWMRNRRWYARAKVPLYTLAVLLPVLALVGFSLAVRALDVQPTPVWFTERSEQAAALSRITDAIYAFLTACVGLVLLARAIPRAGRVKVTYADGASVTVEAGTTILEASRIAARPHLSVCGGRGRCSTCRVKVLAGADQLPEPSVIERTTLERIGAPPNVRLACQLRPVTDVTVSPVIKPAPHIRRAQALKDHASGRERQLAVLFCDLRDFTRLSEEKLPFDTMFLLNSYFEMVGEAVEQSGGVIDKFIGDGALIHFGLADGYRTACIKAITAAVRISQGIEDLNRSFKGELKEPLRVAMGMHAGPAIIGRVGYGEISELTVVGDTVNIASRLEGIAKEHDAELAVSSDVLSGAGMKVEAVLRQEINLRGRAQPVAASIFADARELSRFLYATL